MSIQRPAVFDAYSCPIGTFPIAPSAVDAVKNGRFCKINAKGQIVLPAAGDKAWMVVFPNELPKKGFATNLGAFLIGAYAFYVDNDTFDDSKTYKVISQNEIKEIFNLLSNALMYNSDEKRWIPLVEKAQSRLLSISSRLK